MFCSTTSHRPSSLFRGLRFSCAAGVRAQRVHVHAHTGLPVGRAATEPHQGRPLPRLLPIRTRYTTPTNALTHSHFRSRLASIIAGAAHGRDSRTQAGRSFYGRAFASKHKPEPLVFVPGFLQVVVWRCCCGRACRAAAASTRCTRVGPTMPRASSSMPTTVRPGDHNFTLIFQLIILLSAHLCPAFKVLRGFGEPAFLHFSSSNSTKIL